MNEITPGPWHTEPDLDHIEHHPYHDNRYICSGDGETQGRDWSIIARMTDHPQQAGNAALIAAAPDLLAALQALFAECAMIHRYGGEANNQREADAAIAAGRAAIAKATGEAQP